MQTIRWKPNTIWLIVSAVVLPDALAQLPASYKFTIYDVPGAVSTTINSINDRGDIAGTYVTPDAISHLFVRLANSDVITTFSGPDGGVPSTPQINFQGQIAFAVGGIQGVPGFGSFGASSIYLRSADGLQFAKFSTFSGDGHVSGINGKGQVLGYIILRASYTPFLFNPDGSTPPIRITGLFGINDAGQLLILDNRQPVSDIASHLFLNNPDGTASGKHLDVPYEMENATMSNTGLATGTFNFSSPYSGRCFIGDLSTNLYALLDVPGYEGHTRALGVNDFGVVVGSVDLTPTSARGTAHGFIATPAVTTPPVLPAGGVTNAASYSNASISPGEVVALFGDGLGAPALSLSDVDAAGQTATSILTTRVLFNGIPAPLLFANASQVSAVVPYEVTGPTASVEVEFQGVRSIPVVMPVTPSTPGIFTLDSSGTGPGAILNQDTSINTVLNPARRGDVIVIYATGFGQTLPAGRTGQIAPRNLPVILKQPLPISVTIGKSKGLIIYDGPAPTLIAGVSQVNVFVPMDAPRGATVPVTIQVGDAISPAGVTVAIK